MSIIQQHGYKLKWQFIVHDNWQVPSPKHNLSWQVFGCNITQMSVINITQMIGFNITQLQEKPPHEKITLTYISKLAIVTSTWWMSTRKTISHKYVGDNIWWCPGLVVSHHVGSRPGWSGWGSLGRFCPGPCGANHDALYEDSWRLGVEAEDTGAKEDPTSTNITD